jgi:hypothetical protein
MKRIEKVGEYAVKIFTLPLRIGVGAYKAIKKEMPEKVVMPFTIKRKEETDGTNSSSEEKASS